MNEYALYNALCMVEEVARQYEEGQKSCPSIRMQADMIASCLYRVAVIGEFKRGKSSLVNALIGTSILPTDILPLTAAITRLTYGVDRKIVVRFKDGASEEKTVDELLQYATKFDERKAKIAASVQEVVVQYPSVLCKNHIEIIDTPGLNDNESMSEVTLSVLGDIDAAIVVINATLPISMTEQRLVCDLIRREGIRHIVFVASEGARTGVLEDTYSRGGSGLREERSVGRSGVACQGEQYIGKTIPFRGFIKSGHARLYQRRRGAAGREPDPKVQGGDACLLDCRAERGCAEASQERGFHGRFQPS